MWAGIQSLDSTGMRKDSDDLPLFARQSRRFFTISELNHIIKGTLESEVGGFMGRWRDLELSRCAFRTLLLHAER